MNTQKHTPTPWKVSKEIEYNDDSSDIVSGNTKIAAIYGYKFWGLTIEEAKANAHRIVSCVNACSEMEDPKKDIFKMNLAMVDGLKTINQQNQRIDKLVGINLEYERKYKKIKFWFEFTLGIILGAGILVVLSYFSII